MVLRCKVMRRWSLSFEKIHKKLVTPPRRAARCLSGRMKMGEAGQRPALRRSDAPAIYQLQSRLT